MHNQSGLADRWGESPTATKRKETYMELHSVLETDKYDRDKNFELVYIKSTEQVTDILCSEVSKLDAFYIKDKEGEFVDCSIYSGDIHFYSKNDIAIYNRIATVIEVLRKGVTLQ